MVNPVVNHPRYGHEWVHIGHPQMMGLSLGLPHYQKGEGFLTDMRDMPPRIFGCTAE